MEGTDKGFLERLLCLNIFQFWITHRVRYCRLAEENFPLKMFSVSTKLQGFLERNYDLT